MERKTLLPPWVYVWKTESILKQKEQCENMSVINNVQMPPPIFVVANKSVLVCSKDDVPKCIVGVLYIHMSKGKSAPSIIPAMQKIERMINLAAPALWRRISL